MSKFDVLEKCRTILATHCDDPSAELIKMGTALVKMGKAIKGLNHDQAKEVIIKVANREIVPAP